MAASRRAVARHIADQLVANAPRQDIMKQLAAYLVANRQVKHAERYVADIEAELASRGTVIADVTTARPLSQDLRDMITNLVATANKVSSGHVQLREHEDANIIGGVIVRAAGKEYDRSVKRAIRGLRSA